MRPEVPFGHAQEAEMAAVTGLKCVLALGGIAHNAVLAARGLKVARYELAHGAEHRPRDGLAMVDAYHSSRLNTNTGRLTEAMFVEVVARAKAAEL